MILKEIQTYLSQRGQASLGQLEQHFHVNSNALSPMLEKLIRKGRVQKIVSSNRCGSCGSCAPETLIIYYWVKAEGPATESLFSGCPHSG
ncbi:FeoC-like transcriptional regulator [Laspinema olomoucense]|uniref:FeoC-like transcriptional regulator n=1 Tax=Laspinema olomoucense D3b TaxID=2953688 RepID=A0ABT2N5V8_9CYAN|nr:MULTISPECIES: FeoC-like transcriptional regulator [unclassified Laspinema]MCT7970756.1 FeoC-like transcriptional regulator [Laspinema sp. D3d]MCT7978086.1 FeoC-like transcriptional regulator [Laspinema sp. D3b]MCT7988879.1 FeoC-like transcriptional regulator [Laspinema sp. D3a]MCT7993694.1 FeoC-like transcriptional regulator [Laspinema sp. D3c]